MSVQGKSDNTLRGYCADCRDFLAWHGGGTIETVDVNTVSIDLEDFEYRAAEYLNLRKTTDKKVATFRRRITSLKALAKYLSKAHGIRVDDLLQYRGPRPAKGIPHPLAEGIEGVLRMIEQADSNVERALVAFNGLLGARISEARDVDTFEIDFIEMLAEVGGKHGHFRKVPISRLALTHIVPAVLDAMDAGRTKVIDLPDRTARDTIKRLARRAGLSGDPASHDLRATFATYVYRRTKDLRLVQELLGHDDPKTTAIYTENELTALRDAVEVDGRDEDEEEFGFDADED